MRLRLRLTAVAAAVITVGGHDISAEISLVVLMLYHNAAVGATTKIILLV